MSTKSVVNGIDVGLRNSGDSAPVRRAAASFDRGDARIRKIDWSVDGDADVWFDHDGDEHDDYQSWEVPDDYRVVEMGHFPDGTVVLAIEEVAR